MPSPAKRKWLLAAVAVALATGGIWISKHRPQQIVAAESTQLAPTGSVRPRVETIHPSTGGMARTTLQPGSAHSYEAAEIYAKVSGYLKTQHVDIGARVQKGQVLAEIDVPELVQEVEREKALLRQAEAEVKRAESTVESMIAERNATQALVAQAEANVKRYVSEREFKEKQYQRIRELHSLNSIEERLVDEKLDQLNAARSAETAAHSAVLTAQQQAIAAGARVANAESELAVAKSKVDVAKAVLEKTKVLLGYSKITSPYDGIVTARYYHPGAFIRSADQGGDIPLYSVDRIDVMRVVVQVPDRDVPYTQVGDKARIRFDALPNQEFTAAISRVAASENPESRTMRVELDLQNEKELIRDGMYGHVEIELEPPAEGLTIPSSCLVGKATREGAQIYIADNGHLRLAKIQIGKDTGAEVEVVSGLAQTDNVVLSPTGALTDGAAVEATAYQPKISSH